MTALSTSSRDRTDSTPSSSHDGALRGWMARHRGAIRIASIIAIIVGLFLTMRTLPIEAGVDRLQDWVDGLGVWGPLVFGVIYVLAAVFFVPGSVITLAAGAIFGLFWGTVTVSLASTTGAAIAFLIGRYAARRSVSQQATKYPRFRVVDHAVGEEGWKVVVLLRLAPVFPFSIGNYLLGLTSIRFWPYIMASWLAMLPGTFLYVYLGHVGRAGIEAAGGGRVPGGGRSAGEWVMLVVGLLATIGLVVYIVRFALRAMQRHTGIEPAVDEGAEDATTSESAHPFRRAPEWPTATLMMAAVFVLALGACASLKPGWLSGMFGPSAVVPQEAYEERLDGPVFDHSTFDAIAKTYVSDGGWVDYAALHANGRDELKKYIDQVAGTDFDALGRDERLALLINAYNAFTLELILEHWNEGDLESIKDIPASKRWEDVRWKVGDHTWSLNQIEHEQVRPKFREPRIHWALVCAAVGCPPLRTEAYTGARIDEQLEDQARAVHTGGRWFSYDHTASVVHATELYRWYGSDFMQVDGGPLPHAAKYFPGLREDLESGRTPRIEWITYDWSLNNRRRANEPGSGRK